MAKILSIGPDPDTLSARNRELRLYGHFVRSAETRALALALAKSGVFEVILLCDQFLPAYAAQLADELRILAPATTIIMLAGRSTPLTTGELQRLLVRDAPIPRAA